MNIQKPKIYNISQAQMKADGWMLQGTTNDETCLNEVVEDYMATGAMDVVFTIRNRSNGEKLFIYWTKP